MKEFQRKDTKICNVSTRICTWQPDRSAGEAIEMDFAVGSEFSRLLLMKELSTGAKLYLLVNNGVQFLVCVFKLFYHGGLEEDALGLGQDLGLVDVGADVHFGLLQGAGGNSGPGRKNFISLLHMTRLHIIKGHLCVSEWKVKQNSFLFKMSTVISSPFLLNYTYSGIDDVE